MTDVLDPPTEASTELASERWEVETSTPVAITGEVPPGDADFVLMSHAEQALGDFPVEFGQPQQLFFQLRDFAQTELGMVNVVGGLLFDRGVSRFGYGDAQFAWAEAGFESLRALLAAFVEQSSGIRRMAQRAIVEDLIERFPVPIFGSPPNNWATVGQIAGQSSCAIFTGYATWTDRPILVLIGGGTSLLIWFAKPSAKRPPGRFEVPPPTPGSSELLRVEQGHDQVAQQQQGNDPCDDRHRSSMR
jgi:hypothetical protein